MDTGKIKQELAAILQTCKDGISFPTSSSLKKLKAIQTSVQSITAEIENSLDTRIIIVNDILSFPYTGKMDRKEILQAKYDFLVHKSYSDEFIDAQLLSNGYSVSEIKGLIKPIKKVLISLNVYPEALRLPFMVLNGRTVKFTDVHLNEKGSGNHVHVVIDSEDAISVLEFSVDRDCDGTFYHARYISADEFDPNNYDIDSNFRFDTPYLLWVLETYCNS